MSGWNFLAQQPRVHVSHLTNETGHIQVAAAKAGHLIRVVYCDLQFANVDTADGAYRWEEDTATARTPISGDFQINVEAATFAIPSLKLPSSPGWFETSTVNKDIGLLVTGSNASTNGVVGYIYVRDGVNVELLDKVVT